MRKRTHHQFGQCALCHGKESGNKPQSFPVGEGRHSVAGLRLCDTHARMVERIAAESGIVWPGLGLAREYGVSVVRGRIGQTDAPRYTRTHADR